MINKKHHITRLIEGGEGLHLDFKFEVSDAAKIARSLVAFANTDGGRLLIGVKDNGTIRGVASEEEYFMLENAASRFCKSEVSFKSKEWNLSGKKVLEVIIPKGSNLPHKAPDHSNKYKAYIRYHDQNILAHPVQVKVWQKQNSNSEVSFYYTQEMRDFLNIFPESDWVSFESILRSSGLSRSKTITILSDLMIMNTVKIKTSDQNTQFMLSEDPSSSY